MLIYIILIYTVINLIKLIKKNFFSPEAVKITIIYQNKTWSLPYSFYLNS